MQWTIVNEHIANVQRNMHVRVLLFCEFSFFLVQEVNFSCVLQDYWLLLLMIFLKRNNFFFQHLMTLYFLVYITKSYQLCLRRDKTKDIVKLTQI